MDHYRAAPNRFDAPVIRGSIKREQVASIKPNGKWITTDIKVPADAKEKKSWLFRTTFKLDFEPVMGAAAITANPSFVLFVNGRLVSARQ